MINTHTRKRKKDHLTPSISNLITERKKERNHTHNCLIQRYLLLTQENTTYNRRRKRRVLLLFDGCVRFVLVSNNIISNQLYTDLALSAKTLHDMMYLRKSQITTTYNKKYTHTVQSIYLFSFLFAAETFRFNIIVKLHKIKSTLLFITI